MKDNAIVYNFDEMTMAIVTLVFGLLNCGLYIIATKWGVVSWYEIHKKKWMPHCEFCLFFWMALCEIVAYTLVSKITVYTIGTLFVDIAFAIVAAVISRFFLTR